MLGSRAITKYLAVTDDLSRSKPYNSGLRFALLLAGHDYVQEPLRKSGNYRSNFTGIKDRLDIFLLLITLAVFCQVHSGDCPRDVSRDRKEHRCVRSVKQRRM
jgi:hypothetical protein